jgi:hypothetical protein
MIDLNDGGKLRPEEYEAIKQRSSLAGDHVGLARSTKLNEEICGFVVAKAGDQRVGIEPQPRLVL